jgi:hypothetical protein
VLEVLFTLSGYVRPAHGPGSAAPAAASAADSGDDGEQP